MKTKLDYRVAVQIEAIMNRTIINPPAGQGRREAEQQSLQTWRDIRDMKNM